MSGHRLTVQRPTKYSPKATPNMRPAMLSTGKCTPATTRLVAMRAAWRSSWSMIIRCPGSRRIEIQQRFQHVRYRMGLRRVSAREASVPRGRDHWLHLGVVFDRTPARERMLEAHFHVHAELQHHVDEFECALGPVGVHVDDRRPESVLGIDLRHDFGGAFVTQFGPAEYHRNLFLERRFCRTSDFRNQGCRTTGPGMRYHRQPEG